MVLLIAAKSAGPGLHLAMGRQKAICRADGGGVNSGWQRLLPREQRLFIAHKFSLLYDKIMGFGKDGLTCPKYEVVYREQVEKMTFVRTEAISNPVVPKRAPSIAFPSGGSSSTLTIPSTPVPSKSTLGQPVPAQDISRRLLDEEVTEVIVFRSPKWADVRRARRYYENKADWRGLFLLRTMRRSDPMVRLH